jgi:hypothetical protein
MALRDFLDPMVIRAAAKPGEALKQDDCVRAVPNG